MVLSCFGTLNFTVNFLLKSTFFNLTLNLLDQVASGKPVLLYHAFLKNATNWKCNFSNDSLTIYDGNSNSSRVLGIYCGDSIPSSHITSSNNVFIQFRSDGSTTKPGFKIEYGPYSKQKFSQVMNFDMYLIKSVYLSELCTYR